MPCAGSSDAPIQTDSDLLSQLTDDHGRLVRAVILHMVHDVSIAEDLAQEVFVRAIERRSQFDQSQGQLPQWLTGIAKHLALDYLKSPDHRLRVSRVPDGATAEPTAEHILVRSAEGRALHSAVERLKPLPRQLIQLAYFQGLSQSAIAAQLRQPLGTVKGRMRSALKQLRVALDQER